MQPASDLLLRFILLMFARKKGGVLRLDAPLLNNLVEKLQFVVNIYV